MVLLVNLGSGEARLVAYGKGVPTELGRTKASFDREWCGLEIVAKGPNIVARWNGEPLIEAVDPNPVSGRAGLATAGQGLTSFDEFILDPTAPPKKISDRPRARPFSSAARRCHGRGEIEIVRR